MRIISYLFSAFLRLLLLPIVVALYAAATFSEWASETLVAIIVTLEFAKNPSDTND